MYKMTNNLTLAYIIIPNWKRRILNHIKNTNILENKELNPKIHISINRKVTWPDFKQRVV